MWLQEIRRELNIEPFVKLDGIITEESEAQNAKVSSPILCFLQWPILNIGLYYGNLKLILTLHLQTRGRCDRCEEDSWLYYYTRQVHPLHTPIPIKKGSPPGLSSFFKFSHILVLSSLFLYTVEICGWRTNHLLWVH